MHRFILSAELSVGEMKIEDREIVHQIKDVLRLRVGEKIVLSDGQGNEVEGEILELGAKKIMVRLDKIKKNENEPKRSVILYCAILKRENFEWVVQKAVEVGVRKIVPIITDRTIKSALNMVRLQKIVKEATEQSGRGIVPMVEKPIEWKKIITSLPSGQVNLFCHFGGEQIEKIKVGGKDIGIWVGPEGGWSEGESSDAKEYGFKTVALGNTVLRAETAATVGSFLAVNL